MAITLNHTIVPANDKEALAQLSFEGLVIVRPSLLIGNRESLGQPDRPPEKLSAVFMKMLERASFRPTTGRSQQGWLR